MLKKLFLLSVTAIYVLAGGWSLEGVDFDMTKKQLTEKGYKCNKSECKKELKKLYRKRNCRIS